jgi:hypothetical protein
VEILKSASDKEFGIEGGERIALHLSCRSIFFQQAEEEKGHALRFIKFIAAAIPAIAECRGCMFGTIGTTPSFGLILATEKICAALSASR